MAEPSSHGHSAALMGGVMGRMALFGVLMVSAVTWEAPPVGIAAMVILGSIVPLWLKARRDDTGGDGRQVGRLQESLERVIDDLERRREADADVQARRIEELEDRLDFAERFLAQRREGEKDPAEQLLIPEPR